MVFAIRARVARMLAQLMPELIELSIVGGGTSRSRRSAQVAPDLRGAQARGQVAPLGR
jgi:hypothetical protein